MSEQYTQAEENFYGTKPLGSQPRYLPRVETSLPHLKIPVNSSSESTEDFGVGCPVLDWAAFSFVDWLLRRRRLHTVMVGSASQS